jgi:transcriptional regulator with XRE-family HTH domain|tara:strand:- start:3013 stop:3255 length:243 start_codon:yes stop_codon:yes gene_type:complete
MMEVSKRNKEEDKLLKSLGDNLKKIRELKNLTQETLAYEAGFSRSYYTEVENGKRNISLINIKKLANVLGISLSEILKNI